jgi:aminoglycoside/choline kinase family phosphotransferase
MIRAAEIDAFLAAEGWAAATRRPLAGDASARSYVRLTRGRSGAMLMDTPPASGLTVAPFLAVTAWLRGLGLSAPEVYAADPAAGLVLLEDLGDDLFVRLAADPAPPPARRSSTPQRSTSSPTCRPPRRLPRPRTTPRRPTTARC